MSQMKTNADSLIRNLESLEGRVMPESHASGVIVKISVDPHREGLEYGMLSLHYPVLDCVA